MQATKLEGALETAINERHDELLRAQMDKITLPMKPTAAAAAAAGGGRRSSTSRRGSRAADGDEPMEGEVFSQSVGPGSATSSASGVGGGLAEDVEEADARRSGRIDFDALLADVDIDEITSPAAIDAKSAEYERNIHAISAALAKLNPNMKAGEQLEETEARLTAETCVVAQLCEAPVCPHASTWHPPPTPHCL